MVVIAMSMLVLAMVCPPAGPLAVLVLGAVVAVAILQLK